MAEAPPKIVIMKGHAADLSAATYRLHSESHTMGNALRWMLMKNPKVEYCGYSVPHPSEDAIQIRIQMYDNLSSLNALMEALDALDSLFETIDERYKESLASGEFERRDERG